jgi:hypothetical protein
MGTTLEATAKVPLGWLIPYVPWLWAPFFICPAVDMDVVRITSGTVIQVGRETLAAESGVVILLRNMLYWGIHDSTKVLDSLRNLQRQSGPFPEPLGPIM